MTFKPKFLITSRLANLLSDIAVCRVKILSLPILPKREFNLVRSARLRMIHSSTAIEGNPLTLKNVERVLDGKIVSGVSEKDRLEVTNYEKVMRYIDQLVEKKRILEWEKTILTIHRLTTHHLLPDNKSGRYRLGPVYVVQQPTQKILYTAPPAKKVSKLMKDFGQWLTNNKTTTLSPVIIGAVAHHQLVTIHPFSDGNGRTARALATLILYLYGYDIKKLFALEDYYNLNRQVYYQAIQKVRQDGNLTGWIEYFAQGLLIELQQVLEQVENFNLEPIIHQTPIHLTQRQRDILDFIATNGLINRSDVVDITSVSKKTAYRELEYLREKGLIKRKGQGPSSHYVLLKNN
jgi:Fic family protein